MKHTTLTAPQEMSFDATLVNWSVVGQWGSKDGVLRHYLVGVIVEDSKGRFQPGDWVRTSWVQESFMEEGDTVPAYVRTLNTTYRLL